MEISTTGPANATAVQKRHFWQGISATTKLFLVQQMGILIRAGVPLTRTLSTLEAQSEKKYVKHVLLSMREAIERGETLAQALAPFEHDFGELMINMVAAGEASGRLDEVLGQLYLQMKKDHEIVAKVRGALTYPAIVVLAMFGIGTFMIVFVVPKLTGLFKEMAVDLPLPTKILIAVSDFLANHGIIATLGTIGSISAFIWLIHQPMGRKIWHAFLLRLPVIGKIIRKVNIARFARTVSSFLKTDIPIVKTLETTAHVLGNVYYRDALLDAAQNISRGITLAQALQPHHDLFNATILQMIAIGEESGSLDSILAEAAEFYEGDVNQTMETLPSLLEPILMLMLGVGVGGMAVAIILPLYTLTEAF